MDPIWNPEKAARNFAKHGVRFSDAVLVLSDPRALTLEDTRFEEQRFITIGTDIANVILVVVYSYPEEKDALRIISARRETPSERRQYEKES